MCYSKEVQLSTGAVVLGFCLFYYFYFKIKFLAQSKKWLMPFLNNVILAFAMIGGHQVSVALSLWTANQMIYKIGLILSISSMYFLIRSLEILLNRDLKSQLALGSIAIVALSIMFREMEFASLGFFVLHKNAFVWSCFWIFLLVYFHVCAFTGQKFLPHISSRRVILAYLVTTIDFSLFLSVVYSIYGYWRYSQNVCTALPSIWCTFSVIQILILPLFLARAPKILKRPEQATSQTVKETLIYLLASMAVMTFILILLSTYNCLATKFAFP